MFCKLGIWFFVSIIGFSFDLLCIIVCLILTGIGGKDEK